MTSDPGNRDKKDDLRGMARSIARLFDSVEEKAPDGEAPSEAVEGGEVETGEAPDPQALDDGTVEDTPSEVEVSAGADGAESPWGDPGARAPDPWSEGDLARAAEHDPDEEAVGEGADWNPDGEDAGPLFGGEVTLDVDALPEGVTEITPENVGLFQSGELGGEEADFFPEEATLGLEGEPWRDELPGEDLEYEDHGEVDLTWISPLGGGGEAGKTEEVEKAEVAEAEGAEIEFEAQEAEDEAEVELEAEAEVEAQVLDDEAPGEEGTSQVGETLEPLLEDAPLEDELLPEFNLEDLEFRDETLSGDIPYSEVDGEDELDLSILPATDTGWVGESGSQPGVVPFTPAETEESRPHPGRLPESPEGTLGQLAQEIIQESRSVPREKLMRTFHSRAGNAAREGGLDDLVEALVLLARFGTDTRDDEVLDLARACAGVHVTSRIVARIASLRDSEQSRILVDTSRALPDQMAPALADALASGGLDRPGRLACVRALVAMGPQGRLAVGKMLEDPRWYVVRNGANIVADWNDPTAVRLLTGALSHDDARVRREAATALARLGGEEAERLLIGLLEDSEDAVRSLAVRGLGHLRVERAVRRLVDRLEVEEDEDLRVEIIRALGTIGDPGAVPALERQTVNTLFHRTPAGIRVAAFRALAAMGTPRAAAILEEAVEDRDPDVRQVVEDFLVRRAEAAARALSREYGEDEDEEDMVSEAWEADRSEPSDTEGDTSQGPMGPSSL